MVTDILEGKINSEVDKVEYQHFTISIQCYANIKKGVSNRRGI